MNETDDNFSSRDQSSSALEPLAVIGVACRLPGAHDANQYWQNLVSGVESVQATSLEEQVALGMPEDEVHDPNFRPVRSILDDPEYFEAAFFGMSAREAQLRDPQHRLFLELAYNAFEDSGYDPARFQGDIGVYAGAGESGYEWLNIRRSKLGQSLDGVTIAVNSHADYMAPLVSYKLNLRGPSFTVHTACSTSMVAIHLACEAVRNGECDMAVAGGASIDLPFGRGYTYVDDGIYSFDGHCRTFDANATGTIWGSGGGAVVLRRLSDALANGDHIRAVILGNAINNDGATKVGFTAPSEQGQVAVIRHALGVADVDGRTVSYVEAHGTGTSLGDPIEVAALTTAYGANSTDTGWCAIGSVKPNIGHLGHAAGVAGVIKTTLALENGFIPPIVNFTSPNPAINFDSSPFYVNTALSAWKSNGTPRRAGVSAFGMGGTNGHLVMQEPPEPVRERRPARSAHLLQLSARTETALASSAKRLADHLAQASEYSTTELDLADVAFTLRAGRRRLGERLAVVASNPEDAAAALADPKRWISGSVGSKPPRVALMFSGQGSQYAGMGAELYEAEPVFRETVDHCCEVLRPELDLDLRTVMFATGDKSAEERLQNTALTQPALFTIEYALAVLWQSWGVEADAMVGHSIGEYVAATLAGVFELDDALRVVAARGRLMAGMPRGAMLAVQLEEDEAAPAASAGCLHRDGERADGLRGGGAGRAGRRLRRRACRQPHRQPAAAHVARLPLRHDGAGPCRVPLDRLRRSAEGCPGAVPVQPDRRVDHPDPGERSDLLGASAARGGALRRLPGHPAVRRRLAARRVRTGPPAVRAGPVAEDHRRHQGAAQPAAARQQGHRPGHHLRGGRHAVGGRRRAGGGRLRSARLPHPAAHLSLGAQALLGGTRRRDRGPVAPVGSRPVGTAAAGALVRHARLAAAAAGSSGCAAAAVPGVRRCRDRPSGHRAGRPGHRGDHRPARHARSRFPLPARSIRYAQPAGRTTAGSSPTWWRRAACRPASCTPGRCPAKRRAERNPHGSNRIGGCSACCSWRRHSPRR